MARFRVCDAVDRGGDALRLVLLRVLVPVERVTGMVWSSDVSLEPTVVDADVGGGAQPHEHGIIITGYKKKTRYTKKATKNTIYNVPAEPPHEQVLVVVVGWVGGPVVIN